MKKFICAVFLLGFLFAMAGCGSGEHPIVGTWELVSIEEIWQGESEMFEDYELTFEFLYEGLGTTRDSWGETLFTWSAEGGVLTITERGVSETLTYNISRSQLTLTFDDGEFTEIMMLRRAD